MKSQVGARFIAKQRQAEGVVGPATFAPYPPEPTGDHRPFPLEDRLTHDEIDCLLALRERLMIPVPRDKEPANRVPSKPAGRGTGGIETPQSGVAATVPPDPPGKVCS